MWRGRGRRRRTLERKGKGGGAGWGELEFGYVEIVMKGLSLQKDGGVGRLGSGGKVMEWVMDPEPQPVYLFVINF